MLVRGEIFDSIAHGRIDHYMVRPSQSPDELFHQAISSMLLEWAEAQHTSPNTIYVVGESWSGRAFELRELLGRCAIPHSFCLADSNDGRALAAGAEEGAELPIVVFPDGTVLTNPSNVEMAKASGSPVNPERMDFDVVIVGPGRLVCRQPCMALRKDSALWSWTTAALAVRRPPARDS